MTGSACSPSEGGIVRLSVSRSSAPLIVSPGLRREAASDDVREARRIAGAYLRQRSRAGRIRDARPLRSASYTRSRGAPATLLPRAMECAIRDREGVRAPVSRSVGRELHVPTLVSHAGDDEAEAGPAVEPVAHETQPRRVVAYEHGGERGAEAAAARVEFHRRYSMNRSARSRSEGGIVRPSVLAVLRLECFPFRLLTVGT